MLSPPTVDEIEQHHPAIRRYIRYLVRDAADADNLALLLAYSRPPGHQG
jgi:DNA-directed RNA polymerase specialized sigma24 family protein